MFVDRLRNTEPGILSQTALAILCAAALGIVIAQDTSGDSDSRIEPRKKYFFPLINQYQLPGIPSREEQLRFMGYPRRNTDGCNQWYLCSATSDDCETPNVIFNAGNHLNENRQLIDAANSEPPEQVVIDLRIESCRLDPSYKGYEAWRVTTYQ